MTNESDKKFRRKIEDFQCEHCGFAVVGDGYTNHCPECLWSKHVDINPGDRASGCGELMAPVEIEQSGGEVAIIHCCEGCRARKHNRTSRQDNPESVLKIARGERT